MTTKEQYFGAIDALEQMLNQNDTNTKVSAESMRGFHHVLCSLMKDAYKNGTDGRQKPDVITALRNMEIPIATATAAVLEMSFNSGSNARG